MDKNIQVNTVKPELSFFENEVLNRLLNFDRELLLDSKIEEVENFIKNNPGHGLAEEAKDALYGNAQSLYNEYKRNLRDVKFNFFLNRPQYNLLTDLILKKLEYDVNTVFIAIELTELLGGMEGTKYQNDTDIRLFEVTATELTYIYHLIQGHKVKGLTKEAYTFSKLLIRIGEVSKVINYYDARAKSLPEEIQQWALRMDASDVVKGESLPVAETQLEA
jgi:hypothetical protein